MTCCFPYPKPYNEGFILSTRIDIEPIIDYREIDELELAKLEGMFRIKNSCGIQEKMSNLMSLKPSILKKLITTIGPNANCGSACFDYFQAQLIFAYGVGFPRSVSWQAGKHGKSKVPVILMELDNTMLNLLAHLSWVVDDEKVD